MQAVILKCRPGAQFHFGRIALDVDTSLDDTSVAPHSDTLFSALVVSVKKAFPEEVERFVGFFQNGEARISSGAFCLELGGDFCCFLPKPAYYNLLDSDDPKALRRTAFLSSQAWSEGWLPNDWKEKAFVLQGRFVAPRGLWEGPLKGHAIQLGLKPEMQENRLSLVNLYSVNAVPKVSVHKPGKEDSLYYQATVQIADNRGVHPGLLVHYYFLLDHQLEGQDAALLDAALNLMADEGIGGERLVGCGQLEEVQLRPFSLPLQSDFHCTVSLTNPAPEDLPALRFYNVATRSGRRTAKDGKLKRVKMVAEGALVKGPVKGRAVQVHGNGLYLRYGKAFTLPVHPNSLKDVI